MKNLAARLFAVIQAAGVPIVSVSVVDAANKATWKVQPQELQSAADPIIAAFDPNDPAHESAELDLTVTNHLTQERIYSAIVWAVIDQFQGPATVAKYNAAKTKIVSAFKTQPWKA